MEWLLALVPAIPLMLLMASWGYRDRYWEPDPDSPEEIAFWADQEETK